jgi:hypothetical protein
MEKRINMSEDNPRRTDAEPPAADRPGAEEAWKKPSAKSFFEKLSATARLTRTEAYRKKLESVDLRQADYRIGKKAYESRVVPTELSSFVTDLDEIGARLAALRDGKEERAAASFGEKAQAAASGAARTAKAKALELKQASLFKDLGAKLRKRSARDPALTAEIAGADAIQEQIKSLDTEIATLRRDSWTKHPLPLLIAAIIVAIVAAGIISLGHSRRVTQVTQPKQQQNSAASKAQAAQLAAIRQQQEQTMARLQQARDAQFQSVQNTQQQYNEAARAAIEKKKQEQAARDEVERQKAEVQKRLQEQMAQKQEESRRQAQEEQKGKVAQGQQKAQELTKKRQEIVAKIVRTKAKIDEQEVAPTGTAVKYAVSPHALHIAAATLKGSRPFMVIDGIAGPAFDELIWVSGRKFGPIDKLVHHGDPQRSSEGMDRQQAPVVFSEDGTRFAYVGRQGDQYVLMVDGKELGRGAYIADSPAVISLSFAPGSNRLRYIRRFPRPAGDTNGSKFRGVQLVVEGDKNPPMETLPDAPFSFSRDGQRYAYFIGLSSDDTSTYYQLRHLIVDGKLDPPDYTVPGFDSTSGVALFTGDSKHLITARSKRIPHQGQTSGFTERPVTIFFDKNPVLEAPHVEVLQDDARTNKKVARPYYAALEELSVAPAGTNYIAVFGIVDNPQVTSTPSRYRVFFNGRQIADVPKVETIDWSPDGKRYSVTCTTKNNSGFMIIDGKREPEYHRVSTVYQGAVWASRAFTADSSKSVYLAWTDKEFLVVQGDESDGFKAIDDLTFSKHGGHIAFVVTTDTGEKMPVIDGNALEPRKDVHDFAFTPDGTHFAFLSGGDSSKKRGAKVVADGVEQPLEFGGDFVHYTAGYEPDRQFVFSADGKHTLYLAAIGKVDTGGYSAVHMPIKAVCLDGKIIPCESERSEVRAFFTPDSKHVIWIDWGGKLTPMGDGSQYDFADVPSLSVYVDGNLAGHFDCPTVKYTYHGMTMSAARFFQQSESASEMGADGTLVFIAQVGNVVKRLRIIPRADTSLATFAALSEEMQFSGQDKAVQEVTPPNW